MTAGPTKPRKMLAFALAVLLLGMVGCMSSKIGRQSYWKELVTGCRQRISPRFLLPREESQLTNYGEPPYRAQLGAPEPVNALPKLPSRMRAVSYTKSSPRAKLGQPIKKAGHNEQSATLPGRLPDVPTFQHRKPKSNKIVDPAANVPAALTSSNSGRRPIDLTNAMRLAGANNLQIALAAEKIRAAQARYGGAKVSWLPSISAGVGYNKHEGRIQATPGEVIEVSRSSLFAGGGPVVGGAFPLNGGAGGPARLAVDFSLADRIFEPLAKLQLVQAACASRDAAFNNSLLDVVSAYLDLLQAQGEVAAAREAVANAERLLTLVQNRVKAGRALPADGLRAETESTRRRADHLRAEEKVGVASAELVRLLSLEPGVFLIPAESHAVPIDLFPQKTPLCDLIAQAMGSRPELAAQDAFIQATQYRLKQESWRPWIPNLHLGMTAGGFGGSDGSQIRNFSDRMDADALLVWNIRNLGFGNKVLRDERASQNLQAIIGSSQLRDVVAKEVTVAYHRMLLRNQQLSVALARVQAASKAVPLNFQGIVGDVLRAVEAQQAIDALASARVQYLRTIIDYNRSQFELLRALGRPMLTPQGEGNGPIADQVSLPHKS